MGRAGKDVVLPCPGDASVSFGDDPPSDGSHDPFDQLRHDLKSPLTVIHARSQLLSRSVLRSPSLTEEERGRMLNGLAVIEAAVLAMVNRIDDLGRRSAP